jgi:hypothetical protein
MNRFARGLALLAITFSVAGATLTLAQIDPQGKPMSTGVGRTEHYEVWHDQGGWHVRTYTKEFDHHFRGTITVTGGEFEAAKGYKLEHRGPQKDLFMEGPEHRMIKFDFSTKGSVDGCDFRVKGRSPMLSFMLMIGEKEPKFEPARIFIGKGNAHPGSNPFELPAHGRGKM